MEWPEGLEGLQSDVLGLLGVGDSSLRVKGEFGAGLSGARVLHVDVDMGEEFSGDAVLKIGPAPWSGEQGESERLAAAIAENPGFAAEHMPTLLRHGIVDKKEVSLCSLAGRSLDNCTNVLAVGGTWEVERGFAYTLSFGLLDRWNKGGTLAEDEVSARALLQRWLGYRLDEGADYIRELVSDAGAAPEGPAFSVGGRLLPNPLAFATGVGEWPASEVRPVLGATHGDLNCNNIVVNLFDLNQYYLIDLAQSSTSAPLLFDHAYLELSYLLNRRGSSSLPRWTRIMDALADRTTYGSAPEAAMPDDSGVIGVVSKLRESIGGWVVKHHRDRGDDLARQTLLARVAAGLNFASKHIDNGQRMKGLVYAAFALKDYLTLTTKGNWTVGPSGGELTVLGPGDIQSDEWKSVWAHLGGFDSSRFAYVLVTGGAVHNLTTPAKEVLARLPWSLVFDLDPSTGDGGLLSSALEIQEALSRRPSEIVGYNATEEPSFSRTLPWVMCVEPGGSIPDSSGFDEWRWAFQDRVRRFSQSASRALKPHPVRVLFLVQDIGEDYRRSLWEAISDAFRGDATYCFVGPDVVASGLTNRPEVSSWSLGADALVDGFWIMIGDAPGDTRVSIPARSEGEEATTRVYLDPDDVAFIQQDFEIVYAGLAEGEDADPQSFYLGNAVTWRDLQIQADLERSTLSELRKEFLEVVEVKRYTNPTIRLSHTPGAGGSTVARRFAWTIKDEYPTLVLTNPKMDPVAAAARIDLLSKKSQRLPVVVIAEAATLPDDKREELYRLLKARHCRSVVVYVRRVPVANNEDQRLVVDEMTPAELAAFSSRYQGIARSDMARTAVRDLATKDSLKTYRLPFFFGLFAFEVDYVHVPEFVAASLPAGTLARRVLSYLALVTRFSQGSLWVPEILALLGLPVDGVFDSAASLGPSCQRLLSMRAEDGVAVVHPIIAEEILAQLLAEGGDRDAWVSRLGSVGRAFIEDLTTRIGEDSDHLHELYGQMFIDRTHDEFSQKVGRFSELIHAIPDPAAQGLVFEALTDNVPSEAHFWNHRARHAYDVLNASLDVSLEYVNRALALEPEDSIHHHTTGMIYRRAAQRLLKDIYGFDNLEKAFEEMTPLFDSAEKAFGDTRLLDSQNTYGYISHVQMIYECVESLRRIAREPHVDDLIKRSGRIAEWCRRQLAEAEDLLDEVETIEESEGSSVLAQRCRDNIRKVYGDYDALLSDLRARVDDPVFGSISRRLIAEVLAASHDGRWDKIGEDGLDEIRRLMNENIQTNYWRGGDVLRWFHAYRRTDAFLFSEALERLGRWASRDDALTAHFYLYVLHFLQWRSGVERDDTFARDHLAECKRLSRNLARRTWGYEWLTKSPANCPMRPGREVGKWDPEKVGFFDTTDLLQRVEGRIVRFTESGTGATVALRGPSGEDGPFEAFFPIRGDDFVPVRDLGTRITFFVGFSYDGLRAWQPVRLSPK